MSDTSLANFACRGFHSAAVSRRHLLKIGGMGLLGLNMPMLLEAAEKTNGPKPLPTKSLRAPPRGLRQRAGL